MRTTILPRKGEQVLVVRSEGEGKDTLYVAQYPDILDATVDVVVGRVTTEDWMDDLNSIVRECELLGLDFFMNSNEAVIHIPEDSKLVGMTGSEYYGETLPEAFDALMDDIQSQFTAPTKVAGMMLIRTDVYVPSDEISTFLGGLFAANGGLDLMENDEEREGE